MAKRALPAGMRIRPDGLYESRFTVAGKRYSVYGNNSKECKENEVALREQCLFLRTLWRMIKLDELSGYVL